MKRYLYDLILEDSNNKVILLSGPRQSGKTTLTKGLFEENIYLNYDSSEDREFIFQNRWKRDVQAVIFDELHKMKEWKRWIKGIYDTEGLRPRIIVTGSVNLDSFSKVGDSLAGRYFMFRLHPIDLKEAVEFTDLDPKDIFNRLGSVNKVIAL